VSHARAAIAGVLAGVIVALAVNGRASISEVNVPVAMMLLGVIALLVLPDLAERFRRPD
jgi:hypothetical protein